jgi:hypothetical protein
MIIDRTRKRVTDTTVVVVHRRKGRQRIRSLTDKKYGHAGKWATVCSAWTTFGVNVTTNDLDVTCLKCLKRMEADKMPQTSNSNPPTSQEELAAVIREQFPVDHEDNDFKTCASRYWKCSKCGKENYHHPYSKPCRHALKDYFQQKCNCGAERELKKSIKAIVVVINRHYIAKEAVAAAKREETIRVFEGTSKAIHGTYHAILSGLADGIEQNGYIETATKIRGIADAARKEMLDDFLRGELAALKSTNQSGEQT